MATMKLPIWVSTLTPSSGADVYGGVRVGVFTSELEAYQDLGEWLEDDGFCRTAPRRKATIERKLNEAIDAGRIRQWDVEE